MYLQEESRSEDHLPRFHRAKFGHSNPAFHSPDEFKTLDTQALLTPRYLDNSARVHSCCSKRRVKCSNRVSFRYFSSLRLSEIVNRWTGGSQRFLEFGEIGTKTVNFPFFTVN